MLNRFAKLLLVSTSLAPVLGAVAVNKFARGEPWTAWIGWLGAGIGCVSICVLMLKLVTRQGERLTKQLSEVESTDKEMLAFLLTYLLPFIASDKLGFSGEWMTGAYILLIVFLAVAHGNAYHFNPVMGLFGYHFYSIKTAGGMPFLLITKRTLRRPDELVTVIQITDSIYMETV
jgi:hypothetical protein